MHKLEELARFYGEEVQPSFGLCRAYVQGIQPDVFDLEMIDPGIYVVTRGGQVVGKGLHYLSAIADFESNIDAIKWEPFFLH